MDIPGIVRVIEIWDEVFFKIRVSFDGLVIRKEVFYEYSHRIDTHIDVVKEVLEISSPRFYELLIKTELKGDTALDLKNFFNHIKMSLNAGTRLIEELLPDYQSIKRHSDFEEYFVPDLNHPSYSWNVHVYASLGH